MSDLGDPSQRVPYDEFGLFRENVDEFDLAVDVLPPVERLDVGVDSGRHVSMLRWGSAPPEMLFIHGGAQNAHTWDTVLLALGRPAVAVDLPGHGHSGWRPDGGYTPMNLADDVADAMRFVMPAPVTIVGMSLGGLTAMELAIRHPSLSDALVMVDITPGVNQEKTKAITDFVDGPQTFARFDDLLARTQEHNPTRSDSSLRRGILHNAHQMPDGSWEWRYDRSSHQRTRASTDPRVEVDSAGEPTASPLWDDFAAVQCPLTLVRGSLSPVVDDDEIKAARRLQPDLRVHVVEGAGHSVQGDRPVELAAILAEDFARP